ncbi:MAG: SufE family protein [Deltaproteobacteria bacterium]|jgi:cysteine desulfuration protein SufE|nr:SufE family protein [Deltaproteobacteria bacterium]
MEFLTPEELIDIFEDLLEWEERYRFIIELGKDLPPIAEKDKTAETKLNGCQSNVWLKRIKDTSSADDRVDKFDFVADSDSQIVKGLVALVRLIYLNKTPQEILDFDINGLFDKIQLTQHLTPNRSNGIQYLINRIKNWAKEDVLLHKM